MSAVVAFVVVASDGGLGLGALVSVEVTFHCVPPGRYLASYRCSKMHLTVVQETCWRKTMVGRWIILGQFPKEERSISLRLDGLFDPSRTAAT